MLIVTWMLAAGENDGGRIEPPTGGGAVGGGFDGAAVGKAGTAPGVVCGVCAVPTATVSTVAGEGVATASGVRVGARVGNSAGSMMGCVAATTSGAGVDVAVGAGDSGGLGDSTAARVGAIAGTVEDGAGEGAAGDPEHAERPGNKRSAANAARLIRVICTRIILASPSGQNTKMIIKLHLRVSACLALVVFALSACGVPNPPASTPLAAPTAAAAATAIISPTTAAPAPTLAPTKPVKPTDEPVDDFSPTKQSVWDTQVGPDSMKGCSGGSILPAYGLVQISPEGNGLVWKNQEPKPYTMTRVKPGVFAYEGPTALNDGTVKMVATFSGPTTVKMTRSFTPKAEAACVHTHEYTGVFKWETAPAATPKP